jgi:hypothetical protein
VKTQQRLLAWHIAHVVPPHVRRQDRGKYSVRRLMGETRTFASKAELQEHRRQQRERRERSVTSNGD